MHSADSQAVSALSSKELRRRRQDLGLTQVGLAEAIGVASNTIARWERGERPISHPVLVARVLDGLDEALTNSLSLPPAAGLPVSVSQLIGRDRELRAVRRYLSISGIRLLTLTGPGGTGKTRLARAAELALRPVFRDGTVFVDLSPVGHASLVLAAIARSLGIRESGPSGFRDQVRSHLAERKLLLVLDNLEHVLAAAPLIAELIEAAGQGTAVLATSREPLHVLGELVVPVPPLQLPDLAHLTDPDELARVPSMALFIERAKTARPDFVLDANNAAPVAELCLHLDGLPLAIELAAARTRLLDPRAILARLGRRLELFSNGRHAAPARHRTLRAALDWSYELLPARERVVLRRLGVFVGGCSLESAEAICTAGGHLSDDLLDILDSLLDKSLLVREDQPGGEPRFRLLETVRAYAREQLTLRRELASARQAHGEYFAKLAREAVAARRTRERPVLLDLIEQEQDELRAAMRWALDAESVELAHWLAAAIGWFTSERGDTNEGAEILASALGTAHAAPATRAAALRAAAELAIRNVHLAQADRFIEEDLCVRVRLGDEAGHAEALLNVLQVARVRGDLQSARLAGEQAVLAARRQNERSVLADTLLCHGMTMVDSGDWSHGRLLAEEALDIARQNGYESLVAESLLLLALGFLAQRQPARARGYLEDSLASDRRNGHQPGIHINLALLAVQARQENDLARATAYHCEALSLAAEHRMMSRIHLSLEWFSSVVAALGLAEQAAHMLGAAEALSRRVFGADREATAGWVRVQQERDLDIARTSLGSTAFEAARVEGARRPLADSVAAALAVGQALPTPTSGSSAEPTSAVLTPREREICALLGRGLTNAQIAGSLMIGTRTVGTHVQHILEKLGFNSRAQVAAWVARQP